MYRFGKPKIVLTLLCLFVYIAIAQEGLSFDATIKGQVLEATPEQIPIPDVIVSIVGSEDPTYVVYTNDKGEYTRTGLPAGRYTISLSKDGYGDRVGQSIVVAAGGEFFQIYKMRKKDTILTFLKKIPLSWILFAGAVIVMIIVFILLFPRTSD